VNGTIGATDTRRLRVLRPGETTKPTAGKHHVPGPPVLDSHCLLLMGGQGSSHTCRSVTDTMEIIL